jgi:hypothetical protein
MKYNDISVSRRAAEILGTPAKVRHSDEHAVEARLHAIRPFCTAPLAWSGTT